MFQCLVLACLTGFCDIAIAAWLSSSNTVRSSELIPKSSNNIMWAKCLPVQQNTCSCVNVDGVMSEWFAVGKWCPARLQNFTWPVPRTNGSYDGTHGTPRDDRCNPGKGGVHWFGFCGWCFFASRNVHQRSLYRPLIVVDWTDKVQVKDATMSFFSVVTMQRIPKPMQFRNFSP